MRNMYPFVLILVVILSIGEVPGKEDQRALKLITNLISGNGYPVEIHEIETEDGYFLTAHRIPNGRNLSSIPNRNPVLLCHGLGGSAENFVWLGSGKSLGFELAENGYDVWLLNSRGSWHSLKHKTLDPDKDKDYWKFSWNEIGIYDTPAAIDYILNITNKNNLHYIGHSQGTTSLFAMGSERESYNDKIKIMIALGPSSVNIKPKHPLIRPLLPFVGIIQFVAGVLNIYRVPQYISVSDFHKYFHFVCGRRFSPVYLCKHLMFIVAGNEHEQFETKLLPLLTQMLPGGSSVNQLIHYGQNIRKGRFEKFDFGKKKNLEIYGMKEPPSYDITRDTFPVGLFYVENDLFVSEEALQNLLDKLPNIVEVYKVPNKEWTHIDMIWGRDVDTLLNRRILEVMKKYD